MQKSCLTPPGHLPMVTATGWPAGRTAPGLTDCLITRRRCRGRVRRCFTAPSWQPLAIRAWRAGPSFLPRRRGTTHAEDSTLSERWDTAAPPLLSLIVSVTVTVPLVA